MKNEEVIVNRWKALPVGEGGPLGPGEGPHRRYSSHWFFSDPHPPAPQAPSPRGKAYRALSLPPLEGEPRVSEE